MSPSIEYRLGVVAVISILYYFGLRYKFIYPPQRSGFTGKGILLVGISYFGFCFGMNLLRRPH